MKEDISSLEELMDVVTNISHKISFKPKYSNNHAAVIIGNHAAKHILGIAEKATNINGTKNMKIIGDNFDYNVPFGNDFYLILYTHWSDISTNELEKLTDIPSLPLKTNKHRKLFEKIKDASYLLPAGFVEDYFTVEVAFKHKNEEVKVVTFNPEFYLFEGIVKISNASFIAKLDSDNDEYYIEEMKDFDFLNNVLKKFEINKQILIPLFSKCIKNVQSHKRITKSIYLLRFGKDSLEINNNIELADYVIEQFLDIYNNILTGYEKRKVRRISTKKFGRNTIKKLIN